MHRANLKEGETLLVHAAAGGVGLAAVQLGVALGAKVIGTAGTSDKLALVKKNGAHEVINYREDDWVERVKALTAGRGADVIYDPVGGDTFDLSTKCIAFEGSILMIGFASGRIPSAEMNRVLVKNFSLVGLHWGLYFKKNPKVIQEAQEAIVRLYSLGKIAPLVSATYPLERRRSCPRRARRPQDDRQGDSDPLGPRRLGVQKRRLAAFDHRVDDTGVTAKRSCHRKPYTLVGAAASATSRGRSSVTCRPGASMNGWTITLVAPCSTHRAKASAIVGPAISMCADSTMLLGPRRCLTKAATSPTSWLAASRRLPWSIRSTAGRSPVVRSPAPKDPIGVIWVTHSTVSRTCGPRRDLKRSQTARA